MVGEEKSDVDVLREVVLGKGRAGFKVTLFLDKFNGTYYSILVHLSASLVVQAVKNPLAMRATWFRSLGWKDPLEKRTVTHHWKIPWTEEPGRPQSTGL